MGNKVLVAFLGSMCGFLLVSTYYTKASSDAIIFEQKEQIEHLGYKISEVMEENESLQECVGQLESYTIDLEIVLGKIQDENHYLKGELE